MAWLAFKVWCECYLLSFKWNRWFLEPIPVLWLQSRSRQLFIMRFAYCFNRTNLIIKPTKSKIYSLVVDNDFISSFSFDASQRELIYSHRLFGLNDQYYTHTHRGIYLFDFHIIHIDYYMRWMKRIALIPKWVRVRDFMSLTH